MGMHRKSLLRMTVRSRIGATALSWDLHHCLTDRAEGGLLLWRQDQIDRRRSGGSQDTVVLRYRGPSAFVMAGKTIERGRTITERQPALAAAQQNGRGIHGARPFLTAFNAALLTASGDQCG